MSQIILDEQLAAAEVRALLPRRFKLQRLPELRPGEVIRDQRVPEILRTLNQPTFITIDHDFWRVTWCHPDYCILYFDLRDTDQELIPVLLRALLRRDEFHTRAARMGKVARVSPTVIDYWQFPSGNQQRIVWQGVSRRRR
jgi:hypothetical protein